MLRDSGRPKNLAKNSKTSLLFVGALVASLLVPMGTSTASSGWVVSKNTSANYVAISSDGKKMVAAQATGYVGGGHLLTSDDYGAQWTIRESLRYWTAVASSTDGTRLVATVQEGAIYTSSNSGLTWAAHEPKLRWTSVASSADGSKLVAVVDPGQIYTSSDFGNTWIARGDNHQWTSVASSSDGNTLVAVAHFDQIYTSHDGGSTWVAKAENRLWSSVTISSDGTKMAAVVYADPGNIFISSDSGDTWILRAAELNKHWQGVAMSADGKSLIASAYNGNVYSSNDFGASWSQDGPMTSSDQVAISADGSRKIATSPLGISSFGMPEVSTTPTIYKATLKVKKITTSQYLFTITSKGNNAKYTITAKKKGGSTLTFTGNTSASGGAVATVKQNLAGYSFSVKVYK